jgi:hypothetical protein
MKPCRFILLPVLFMFCLLITGVSCKSAKPEPDIAGEYATGSGGDPQGGATLFVLPDHRFVVVFFGGASMGTWEIKDSTVLFKPKVKQAGFNVYGKHNPKLGDSIRVFFDGFDTAGGAAIGFDASTKNVKQVFNDSPNCPEFPYIGKFAGRPTKIVLAARPVDQGGSIVAGADWQIYTCDNADHYNDFIARYEAAHAQEQPQDFNAEIKNGKLYFDRKESKRKPLSDAKGELRQIKQLLNTSPDPETVWYNPYFKEAEPGVEKDTLNYRFDKKKNAYISFHNYVEGEENKTEKDGDYNGMNVVYPYRKLPVSKNTGQVNLDAKPLFTAKCKDE